MSIVDNKLISCKLLGHLRGNVMTVLVKVLNAKEISVVSEQWANYQIKLGNISGDELIGYWYKGHYLMFKEDEKSLWMPHKESKDRMGY